jgi:large subunit ribosomal protein L15
MRGFEGGQMPLHRRLPKRGFVNIFREEYAIVNLSELASLGVSKITPDLLRSSGLVSGKNKRVKVLGDGELKSALTVQAHKFSKSAEEKIKNAGGSASIIEIKPPAPVKNRFEQARAQKRAGKQKKQA